MQRFNTKILSTEDRALAVSYLGGAEHGHYRVSRPNLVIAPDGVPYLYRWYLIPRNEHGNNYLHIQVGDDPERPLHDHPWDNQSVILSGGYHEALWTPRWAGGKLINPLDEWHTDGVTRGISSNMRTCLKGDVVHRRAELAHRLFLPEGVPYTMTLFSTGPVNREWGFWFPEGWRSHKEVIGVEDGMSVFKSEERS